MERAAKEHAIRLSRLHLHSRYELNQVVILTGVWTGDGYREDGEDGEDEERGRGLDVKRGSTVLLNSFPI